MNGQRKLNKKKSLFDNSPIITTQIGYNCSFLHKTLEWEIFGCKSIKNANWKRDVMRLIFFGKERDFSQQFRFRGNRTENDEIFTGIAGIMQLLPPLPPPLSPPPLSPTTLSMTPLNRTAHLFH